MAGPPTHTTLMVNGNGPPDLPPRVDRNTKPLHGTRANGQRSATDRLFSPNGMEDIPNYINATPHHQRTHTSTSKQVNAPINDQIMVLLYIVILRLSFSCTKCIIIVMTVCRRMIVMVHV